MGSNPDSRENWALSSSSSSLRFFFSCFLLYLIIESELDLDRVKGESPLLELFLAQMMSVMCCATRVMATESKGGFSGAGNEAGREGYGATMITRKERCVVSLK